jgi:hypothetical protein
MGQLQALHASHSSHPEQKRQDPLDPTGTADQKLENNTNHYYPVHLNQSAAATSDHSCNVCNSTSKKTFADFAQGLRLWISHANKPSSTVCMSGEEFCGGMDLELRQSSWSKIKTARTAASIHATKSQKSGIMSYNIIYIYTCIYIHIKYINRIQ